MRITIDLDRLEFIGLCQQGDKVAAVFEDEDGDEIEFITEGQENPELRKAQAAVERLL